MKYGIIIAAAWCLAAQEPRFDVRSRLVLIPTTVTDAKGRSVAGLEAADFQVFDNGRLHSAAVDTIDTGLAPIALVIVVQSSGISAAVIEKVRRIGNMIQPLLTGDRGSAALLAFDHRIEWLQDFTKDQDVFDRGFEKLRPELHPGEDKQARMLDAVQSAIERLDRRPNARRVLLLISESRDRGSESQIEKVAEAAQSSGVTIYAATYSAFTTGFTSKSERTEGPRPVKPQTPTDIMGTQDGRPSTKYDPKKPPPEFRPDAIPIVGELVRLFKENAVEVLTKGTGGAIFSFTRQKALEQAIDKLSTELHSQYVLSFVPEASAPGYHPLVVRLTRPGDFSVRARPGYWSKEEPHN